MNAIIVDDEASAREVLEALLEMNHPEVKVIDRCADIDTAVASIQRNCPDVVFLDIEMPGGLGFEIVNRLECPVEFEIVFVTAYDMYAIKAFEVAALDYLLKPIEEERLEQAIDKVRTRLKINDIKERLTTLQQTMASPSIQRITVYHKGERFLIPICDIIAIQAQGAYCNIFIQGEMEELVISKNLKQLELILEGNEAFFRSHRSWIVNTKRLISYSKLNGTITLENEIKAKLSEYKVDAFEKHVSPR